MRNIQTDVMMITYSRVKMKAKLTGESLKVISSNNRRKVILSQAALLCWELQREQVSQESIMLHGDMQR